MIVQGISFMKAALSLKKKEKGILVYTVAHFQIQASFFYVENHKNCTIPDFLALSLNFCQISLLSNLSYTEAKDLLLHVSFLLSYCENC